MTATRPRRGRAHGLRPKRRPGFVRAPIAFTLACLSLLARADDWPQFRGPARNGHSPEKGWLANWPEKGSPKELWRAKIGKGHAAPSVVGDRLFIAGWDGQNETVVCLDVASGKTVWKQSYFAKTIRQWPGPRATPTVADGAVYTVGTHGEFSAWAAGDGKRLWQVKLNPAWNPDDDYGFAWSPLVQGDLLILPGGSRGVAYRRKDGSIAWGGDASRGACASAVPYTHNDRPAVALITQANDRESSLLVGVDAGSGAELWRHGPWREKWGAVCADPLIADGKLFVTTAEQFKRSARFSIGEKGLKEDWQTDKFASYTGGCVLVDGHLYGVSHATRLTCLDWNTGKVKWSERGFGEQGSLIAADGLLVVQTHKDGDLIVVRANPEKYEELRRAKVFESDAATFTAPVLANGRWYCRSYAGELVCLDLGGR